MQYTRITSDGSDLSWLKELERRISTLETPATGDVAVRGLITATDPVTGVQTQIGKIPGSTQVGIKQFVYDITPPPVATAPVAKAEPGVFIVSWDGLFVGDESSPPDFECCNIIGHKIVGGATVDSVPVGMTRRPLDITFVQTDVAAFNEEWEFSLEAEDYNGNRAAWSARSNRVTMLPIAGEVDLTGIQQDIDAAASAAAAAQQAASTASSDAAAASAAALAASNLAASKGKVLFQTTAPTGADANAQTLWIDTTNNLFKPMRWVTGTTWTVATDKTATDAAQTASDAFSLAQSKGKVLFQTTAPTGADANVQTLWIDTTGGANTPKRWTTGTTWVTATDKVATDAAAAALAASNLATSKGKVLIQSAAPAAPDQLVQNLWIDTTGGANTPKRWDTTTSTWIVVTDKAATDAAAAAVTAQSKADTAFNNAATAATAAGNAQTTADSKNRVWYQTTAPAGTAHKLNDIWFDTANDNRISKWNTTTNLWELSLIGNSAIFANLDAGKMTAGFLAAARIQAKTMTLDKLVITSTDNLVVEADFSNNGSSWAPLTGTTKTINATAGRGGLPAFRVTATSILQTITNQSNKVSVGSEDRFRGSFYVKNSVALAAGAVKLRANCYTNATTSTAITIVSSPALAINTSYVLVDGISPVLPADTLYIEFFLEVLNPTTATITDIDYVGVTRAADGKLTLDGAMDAKSITGALIQTDNTPDGTSASRGIKFNTLGFRGYNTLGQKTFDLNASTGDLAVTGTFSSGTAPGTDTDVGQTIRVQMGILNFQNWQNVPGLTFQKFDSGTGATTPSGFIFYYFQGFLMRSTVPSTVWVAFKNESYLWIAQDAVHISGNNTGKANYGTAADRYTRAGISASATPNGVTGLNQNDAYARMHVTAVVEGDNVNEHYQSGLGALAGPGYGGTKGFTQIYHGKFNTTSATYQFTSVLTISNSNFSLAVKAVNGTMDQSYIRSLDYNGGGGNWLQMAGDVVKVYGGFGSAAATGTSLSDKGSMQINAGGSMFISPAATSGVAETDRATITAESQGSFLLAPRNTPGGSRNYIWATLDNVGISGTFQINGENNIKHHRAEFTSLFAIAGGNASWDTGPAILDTDPNRTRNNDFCVQGDTNGSIKFTRAGYYMIQLMFIPTGNPGSGWVKLNHSNGMLIGMDKVTEGQKHEAHISTVPIFFGVNESVRSQTALSLGGDANTRWRVVRSTLNL